MSDGVRQISGTRTISKALILKILMFIYRAQMFLNGVRIAHNYTKHVAK